MCVCVFTTTIMFISFRYSIFFPAVINFTIYSTIVVVSPPPTPRPVFGTDLRLATGGRMSFGAGGHCSAAGKWL